MLQHSPLKNEDGAEGVVVVVQCRATETEARSQLMREVRAAARLVAGVDCTVVLAQPRSLPMTSSGKLSRTAARENYLAGRYAAPRPIWACGMQLTRP